MPLRFPFRIGRRSAILLRLWRVKPDTAYVELDGDLLLRFGFIRLRTPLSNVASWRIEGPFRWISAIGVRRGVRDGEFSFCGDTHGAVRLELRERLRWNVWRVPALWAGVDDLEGLGAELERRGIPGQDARRR